MQELRGFCASVRELKDALLWLTVEGAPGSIEVQAWLPAFALDLSRLEAFEKKWQQRLREIFPNC